MGELAASRDSCKLNDVRQLADWLHTLPFEAEVIWPARWNVVKFLYFFSRYFPIDIIFSYICESPHCREAGYPINVTSKDIEVADVEVCLSVYFQSTSCV